MLAARVYQPNSRNLTAVSRPNVSSLVRGNRTFCAPRLFQHRNVQIPKLKSKSGIIQTEDDKLVKASMTGDFLENLGSDQFKLQNKFLKSSKGSQKGVALRQLEILSKDTLSSAKSPLKQYGSTRTCISTLEEQQRGRPTTENLPPVSNTQPKPTKDTNNKARTHVEPDDSGAGKAIAPGSGLQAQTTHQGVGNTQVELGLQVGETASPEGPAVGVGQNNIQPLEQNQGLKTSSSGRKVPTQNLKDELQQAGLRSQDLGPTSAKLRRTANFKRQTIFN